MTGCSDVITFYFNNSAYVLCSLLHRRYLISKPHSPLITVCTFSQILFFYYIIDEYRHDASVISSAAAVPKIIQVGLRNATLKHIHVHINLLLIVADMKKTIIE